MFRFLVSIPRQARVVNISSNCQKLCSTLQNNETNVAMETDDGIKLSDIQLKRETSISKTIKTLNLHIKNSSHFTDLDKDPEFQKMVDTIIEEKEKIRFHDAFQLIQQLTRLHFPQESLLLEMVHTNLETQQETLSIQQLFQVLSFSNMPDLDLDRIQFFKTTVELIEKRWKEIDSPYQIQLCYENNHYFSRTFLFNIDEQAMFIVRDLPVHTICELLLRITKAERSPLVLNSFIRTISETKERIPQQLACRTLSALTNTNSLDSKILFKLSNEFLAIDKPFPTGNSFSELLFIIGQAKWKNLDICERICSRIVFSKQRSKELKNLLGTLAMINHIPSISTDLANSVWDSLGTFVDSESSLVNVVWSLAVLDQIESKHLGCVLLPSAIRKLGYSDKRFDIAAKLMQINAIAEDHPSFTERALKVPPHVWKRTPLIGVHQSLRTRLESVFESTSLRSNDWNFDVRTPYGFKIDAELFLDAEGQALCISDYRDDNTFTLKNDLPEGSRKLAFVRWHKRDFTTDTEDLIGFHALSIKILKRKGYLVLELPCLTAEAEATRVENFLRTIMET